MSAVRARVIAVVSRAGMVPPEALESGQTLPQLGIGSLEQIEAVLAIEDEFQIEVSDTGLRQVKTIQDLVELVEATLAARGARATS